MSDLTIGDYEKALNDKRRLTRELDVALHGEEGAAKQASLCDLIGSAKQLRDRLTLLQEANRRLVEALKPFAHKGFSEMVGDNDRPIWGFNGATLNVGDFRAARDRLSELEQDKSDGPQV